MRTPGSRLRCTALMAAAALGLHALRSEAALGEHAHGELAQHAHGYINALTLVVGLLLAVAATHLIARLMITAHSPGEVYGTGSALRLWSLASICLVAGALGQDIFESVVANGRPPALGEALGDWGWTTLPLAVVSGGGVALASRGSDLLVELFARSGLATARASCGSEPLSRPRVGYPPALRPLSDLAAGRAPPPLAVSR